MTISATQILNIFSSLCGVTGTIVLFKGSFAYETMPHYMGTQSASEMSARNARRNRLQKLGMFLLVASFILTIISQFL